MKKFAALVALLLCMNLAFAQTQEPTVYRVTLREGSNTVLLKPGKGRLALQVRDNNIISMIHVADNGKTTILKGNNNSETSGNQSCPCGQYCWEDNDNQVCICTCGSCGGGQTKEHILLARQ